MVNPCPKSTIPVYCASAVFGPVHREYRRIQDSLDRESSKLFRNDLGDLASTRKNICRLAHSLWSHNIFWERQAYVAYDTTALPWCRLINREKVITNQLYENVAWQASQWGRTSRRS